MSDATVMERFLSYVDRTGECWLWQGGLHNPRGYGQFHIGYRSILAHRASYELFCGPIPPGLWVLHNCDNSLCVNPDHLYLGTTVENVRDQKERKRWAYGLKNGVHTHPEGHACGERVKGAKLTAKQVIEMRKLRAEGWLHRQLAEKFGVARQTVTGVVSGKEWAHIQSSEQADAAVAIAKACDWLEP